MKAMLQSIVSTLPSMQNGSSSSPPISGSSAAAAAAAATCDICRICHCEAEVDAPLIAPCICAGSLRYVHQACLQQWIKSSNTKKCELCKFEFIMHTKIKPLRQWERLQMTSMERRKIFCSVTFHFVAITCVVWSLYVLIDRTSEEVKAGVLEWPFWTKLIVVAIGFSGGLVFMYVQCKMYLQLCQRWKAFNRIIYVQNAPPKSVTNITTGQNGNGGRRPSSSHPLESTSLMVTSKVGDTYVVPISVTETTTTRTTTTDPSGAIPVDHQEMSPTLPPRVDVDGEHSTPRPLINDDHLESVTVISGSEVTMVEPIERVT